MDQPEAAAYMARKFARIRASVADGDTATAAEVLDEIRTEGYPQAYAAIWDALLDVAPERITAMFGTPQER